MILIITLGYFVCHALNCCVYIVRLSIDSSAVHVAGNEFFNVVKISFLRDCVVVVAMRQLFPNTYLSFAEFEKLLHVCRSKCMLVQSIEGCGDVNLRHNLVL